MFAEVGVFDRTDTHCRADAAQLVGGQLRVLLLDQAQGALLRLVQQISQLHGAAVAGLEGLAVGAVHGAKAHVLQLHVGRDKAGLAGNREHLLEVQGLTLVDEIKHAVGLQLGLAIAHGSQIRGGVQVAATGFLHDDRQRVAFGIFELLKEDALGAFAFSQQASAAQIGNDARQIGVVGAFAAHIGRAQADAQAVVDGLAVAQRNAVEALPQSKAARLTGLQVNHTLARAVGKIFALVKALLGLTVEVFQIAQLGFGVDAVLFHVGQQHAELGAPVAHVVLADHRVAEGFKHPGHGVADDGGTQVAHVHFLRQVGRGVVDHHALGGDVGAHVELLVGQRGLQLRRQPAGILEEVDKAGAGDVDRGNRLMGRQRGNQLFSQIARLHTRRLGQHHRQVAGEVAMGLVARVLNLNGGRDIGRQYAVGLEAVYGVGKQLADQVLHLKEYPAGAQ